MPRLCAPILALLLATACASDRSSPECKDVCSKQARCVDQKSEAIQPGQPRQSTPPEQIKFDQSECIAACTALMKDAEARKVVARHVACFAKAGDDCEAILACP